MTYFWLFLTVSDCFWLIPDHYGYFWQFLAIFGMSSLDTPFISPTKEREVEDFIPSLGEKHEDPPETPTTCASPSTSLSDLSEAQVKELRQLMDRYLNS